MLFSSFPGEDVEHDKVSFSHGVDRDSEGGSSFLAYFNIVCVVAGTGALGLPYALRQGGWIGNYIMTETAIQYAKFNMPLI